MTSADVTPGTRPDRDECVEQTYFFRNLRGQLADNVAAQDAVARIGDELLTTTRLPMAVAFVATELRHSGLVSSGFLKLPHYFTPYQAFVVQQAEDERRRFTMPTALLVLEREAEYKAGTPTPAGLFVYQFESIARNRLGYEPGMTAVAGDPLYGPEWKAYLELVRLQVGVFDFADLVYLRSDLYVTEQRRLDPGYNPPVPPLYAEKEGKIAKASRGRDPLYLFAGLQRQLGYPEVARIKPKDTINAKMDGYDAKIREMEARLRMLEAEQRGTFDPTQFAKPEMFRDAKDDEI
ncbi:MAG: hypothetical protein ACRC7O_15875 [Fimbriiglobus sp.]